MPTVATEERARLEHVDLPAQRGAHHPGGNRERTVAAPEAPASDYVPDSRYEHLGPLLAEHASLAPQDPRRKQLRGELLCGYLPIARHIAQRFARRGEPLEDLTQVASLGLLFAIDRFEPELGRDFLAFAVPTIQGEVRRYFRDKTWSVRVPRRLKDLHVSINAAVSELSQRLNHAPRPSEIADLLAITVEEVLEGLQASDAHTASSLDQELTDETGNGQNLAAQLGTLDPNLEFVEQQHALRPLLNNLRERERTILILRFYGEMTQTQIAERCGISQMHVSRLLAKTLSHLREELQRDD
jgi:RNA polymerase sigma-B factor